MREDNGYYYHVRITLKSKKGFDELKLDLNKSELADRFIVPYEFGNTIMMNGKSINPSDIERFHINRTKESSPELIPKIRAKRAGSNIIVPISTEWYVTEEGEDLTDKFVLGPPGYKKDTEKSMDPMTPDTLSLSRKIFIVHGHNEEMKQAVARTIGMLDLEPIILHEQPNEGKTIIEKFEKHSQELSFTIILLSPDDKGCTVDSFPGNAKFRARQNVILEMGYFVGKFGRERVFVLHNESKDFDLPSDITGVLYTSYKDKWQFELVRELKACGYEVDANKIL